MRHKAWALSAGRTYTVLGIEANDYRILDDTGAPYLYPNSWFRVVDGAEPTFWLKTCGADGERYAYPVELGRPGFFEDYFDGKAETRREFWFASETLYGIQRPDHRT